MQKYILNVVLCLLLMNGFFFVSLGADASSVQAFIQKSLACGAAVFFT